MKKQKNNAAEEGSLVSQSTDQPVYHTAVMLHEAVDALNVKPDGVYVDGTFGGGGHSREILKRLGREGRLIVFDQDEDAQRNLPKDERVLFVAQNFRHLHRFLRLHKHPEVEGVLADLGVSSHQFDEAGRGFSIRFDAPLDMRMDQRKGLTAADLLNTYSEQQLHKLFEKYGEVTNAKTLAKLLVEQRNIAPFTTTEKLMQVMRPVVKGNPHKYFAQVFQALRIEVNDEMGALRELLEQSAACLKPGGRIAVITFHSLEDRMVKNFFRWGSVEEPEADTVFGTKPSSPFELITKKPVTASAEELKKNPRARSAKLRTAQKK